MAYLALYREWRPRNFNDMVGQRHVTQTLLNALKQERIAHAYLFSGPRGTGKTTAAKILAKALNCESNSGGEPCNRCPSCTSIDQGHSMEVYEIDAASNRGIDEIRDLREKVKLSTAQGKYKVYIIDEVHMLTTEAFNALLKTLEEPPSRVVFVLATTEAHKIPVTILSRVQRFEFHRIPVAEIESRLLQVCQSLKRSVKEEALTVIAQKSEGGLRDALSILDQCLLQDGDIGIEHVYAVLGMVGEEFSSHIVEALLEGNYNKTISLLTQGVYQGRDPRQILRELLEYLRQLMLCTASEEKPLIPAHLLEGFYRQSKEAGLNRLLKWISILLEGEAQLRYAPNARLAAELLLIKTIYEGEEIFNQAEVKTAPLISKRDTENSKQSTIKALPKDSGTSPQRNTQPTILDKQSNLGKSNTENISIDAILTRWSEVLELVKKSKRSTHAFLMEGNPCAVENSTLTIGFKDGLSFHRDKLNNQENKQTVESVLKTVFGQEYKIVSVLESELKEPKAAESPEDSEEERFIRKTGELFGQEFIKVKKE